MLPPCEAPIWNTFYNVHRRMDGRRVPTLWREKFTIFMLIFLNAIVDFYIIGFGRLLCPNYDKAWRLRRIPVMTRDDRYVATQGGVYDITNFMNGGFPARRAQQDGKPLIHLLRFI
jgi:hypothetical protein